MSTEIERIKRLAHDDLIVDAVELPANHKKKSHIVEDIEEVLAQFDDDMDYAHFVVRVRRSNGSLKTALNTAADGPREELSFESLVDETLNAQPEKTPIATDRDPEKDPAFLLENARILEENGEFSLARNIFAALIKSGAHIAQAHAGLARTYEKEGLLEQAIRSYREAIAYASELAFYQALAALQIRVGDDREASKTLLHALGVKGLPEKDRFEFHKSLGNCFVRLSEFDKAEHHYARAYEIHPRSDALQVNLGSLALQKGRAQDALEHFQKALELAPSNDKAICGIGMVFLQKGEAEKAFDHFLSSLRANPSNITALLNLFKCGLELKRYDETAQMLEAYIAKNAPSANVLFSYAGVLFHKGDLDKAQKQVERILGADADHAGALELRDLIARRRAR